MQKVDLDQNIDEKQKNVSNMAKNLVYFCNVSKTKNSRVSQFQKQALKIKKGYLGN